MGSYTITASTLIELLEMAQTLAEATGHAPADAPSETAPVAGETAPKPTRTRKKAEAPAPIQPTEAAAPAESNPFAQQEAAAAATPFMSQPEPAPFAGAAADPHFNPGAERPLVTKLKDFLQTLADKHGEPQVYTWCMQKALGLSPSVTKDEFLSKTIHTISDADLEACYKQGGGKN